jgi:hypothetical protein
MMDALYDLVANELSRIENRAQDKVHGTESWNLIYNELETARVHLRAKRYWDAAEAARVASKKCEEIIKEQASRW